MSATDRKQLQDFSRNLNHNRVHRFNNNSTFIDWHKNKILMHIYMI